PADAALEEREAQLWETLEHARRAHARHRFDRRRERVRGVVDDRAAVLARGARIAPGRDVKRDREIAVLNYLPHGIEERHVVVGMSRVVRTPNRLAWQRDAAETRFRRAADFRDGEAEISGHDSGHRRPEVIELADGLP